MRKNERNYEFREKMMKIHKENLRNFSLKKNQNEIEISDGLVVDISDADTIVTLTAAKDFQEFMLVSMNVSVMISRNKVDSIGQSIKVSITPETNLGEGNGYMGYKLIIDENIQILAHDERGAAQAFYHLEDLMTLRKAPYLENDIRENRAMFSPRMIHSGYGIDQFPDSHLRDIAHAGMDAILVFVKAPDITTKGYLDFNELIARASVWGLDVYAYSYLKSERHPDDKDAAAYYDASYGQLFKKCPKLKGIVMVGESVEFPTKDERVSPFRYYNNKIDGIPTGKKTAGWFPCRDYPQWLDLIKSTIRKYNPEADIVFWTYNFSNAPKEDRLKLIESLPRDISVLVTFEKSHRYVVDGVAELTTDYTLSLTGPSQIFLEEGEAAKKRGIRLYSMTNTGGQTWDFGVIPYEPMPYQWQARHEKIIEAKEKYGLCGLMESHHYGFYPSFISELAKWNFTHSNKDNKGILRKILASLYDEKNVGKVEEGLKHWSEAIKHYIADACDQYSAFRIGPAYPLCFLAPIKPPSAEYAHFGAGIVDVDYFSSYYNNAVPSLSTPMIRIHHEIKSIKKLEELLINGIKVLEEIENPNDELEELIDIGKFMEYSAHTAINVKSFAVTKAKLYSETEPNKIEDYLNELEKIAHDEIENAKRAIPLVKKNSRLGWEPSMEYLGDERHILWKLKQMDYMLEHEIGTYKKCLQNDF